jgi:O-acetyl-ADP-ribose deacetylase (regulator of RNase III)
MIRYTTGNLLEANADALVNTVNSVGVMGKGIALQFKQAFPDNYEQYRRACERGEVRPGRMFVVSTGILMRPRFIVNFPTKRHWKTPSHIEDVDSGLDALIAVIREKQIESIAVPPLGCGNGGLDWRQVRPLIERKLSQLDNVEIVIYEPAGAPENRAMKIATMEPNMTRGRAALLGIFSKYLVPGYELTMLEMQKLAYFLQEAGEPLRLQFVKDKYGPYAETLHHVLQRIEGHFIHGYGDRSRDASVQVVPEAVDRAMQVLKEGYPDTLARADRVVSLIDGFETPFGLELLSTVHWILKETPSARGNLSQIITQVHSWNERKARVFTPVQIGLAWQQLDGKGWITPCSASPT